MDFVLELPKTKEGHDTIWVVVYRLTKSTHFLPIRTTYTMDKYAEIYVREILKIHGILVSIISDRDSSFWKSLHKALGTRLAFSTAFHL